MRKQYLVIYLLYDSGCLVQCVWDYVFACRVVKFLSLVTEQHIPELCHTQAKAHVAGS